MANKQAGKINDRAIKLINEGNYQAAEKSLHQLINDYPQFISAYYNLANLYFMQEKLELALQLFEQVIKLDPSHAKSYLAIAMILEMFSRYGQALDYYDHAYKLDPNLPNVKTNLCHLAMHTCDWQNLKKRQRELFNLDMKRLRHNLPPEQSPFQSLVLFPDSMINLLVAKSVSQQIKAAVLTDSNQEMAFDFSARFFRKSKIRLGYLSADFYNHPTAYLLENLFTLHNRKQFTTTAYSYGPDDQSYLRKKIISTADNFVELNHLTDWQAAQKIYEDQIDILIDLKGHTQNNRLGIAAFKPAPVQITYLGFPGSTGADFFDYLIADQTVIPQEQQSYYSEKIIYLPNSYQINCRSPLLCKSKNKYLQLPKNKFIFAFLGRSYKIDQAVFASWMKILLTVKNSVLWLLDSNPKATANLIRAAQSQGVDSSRLIFAPLVNNQTHLCRLKSAHLCLDTWVYSGHTTTSDCLYVGTPVINLLGNHFASRVSSSLLKAANLPELITHSASEYEHLAIKLSTDKDFFKNIKNKLKQNINTCPLFKQRLSVKNLETIYTNVWNSYQHKHSKRSLKKTLIFNVTDNPNTNQKWPDKSIAIICGPQLYSWDPDDVAQNENTHIGGSEEAVIYLSQELNKQGYKITVFGQPKQEKKYKNVRWLSFKQLNPSDQFATVVYWRSPNLTKLKLRAQKKYLWLHDVIYPEEISREALNELDKIIVLSKSHRQILKQIPDEKILISGNGLKEHQPLIKPHQNPFWCLWTSSYDRGLDYLLALWPKVLKVVPKAQLHVFYGWQTFEQINRNHPPAKKFKNKIVRLLKQPGVIHHGRMPQTKIELWYKKCGLFVYPTCFYEISCISAIKAQAFGCVPIVTNYAALSETVKYGFKIKGEINQKRTQKQFLEKLIYALKNPEWQQNQRQSMIAWAQKKFSWRKIAYQWLKEINCENSNN